jgi:hypothetical protein
MAFVKGQKKTGGKVKGSVNHKTKAWEALGDFFTEAGAERAKEIMMSSNSKDFMNYYCMLIELFKPKLARQELTGKDGEQLNMTIPPINVYNTSPPLLRSEDEFEGSGE